MVWIAPFPVSAITTQRPGLIGLCPCPGRKYPLAIGGAMQSHLKQDLLAIQAFSAVSLVTLMEMGELDWAGPSLDELTNICNSLNIKHYYLPIVDGDIPDAGWEAGWERHGPDLHSTLIAGRNIAFHCRGGRGRSGLAAARMLIELGETPAAAMARVRMAQPGAIETRAQEEYLLRLQL